jgi:hypothetical protein
MFHDKELLSGVLQQILFNPKGAIEGLLLKMDAARVQVSMKPDQADARLLQRAVGTHIELKASADDSPKSSKAAHAVYRLHAITELAGKSVRTHEPAHAIDGVVAAIHYAKHGEPNGVVLESGEFIHIRPPGMKLLKLKSGSKVTAHGEVRTTVLGTPLMEAHEVNRVTLG